MANCLPLWTLNLISYERKASELFLFRGSPNLYVYSQSAILQDVWMHNLPEYIVAVSVEVDVPELVHIAQAPFCNIHQVH